MEHVTRYIEHGTHWSLVYTDAAQFAMYVDSLAPLSAVVCDRAANRVPYSSSTKPRQKQTPDGEAARCEAFPSVEVTACIT